MLNFLRFQLFLGSRFREIKKQRLLILPEEYFSVSTLSEKAEFFKVMSPIRGHYFIYN